MDEGSKDEVAKRAREGRTGRPEELAPKGSAMISEAKESALLGLCQ